MQEAVAVWDKLKPFHIALLTIAWEGAVAEGLVTGAFNLANPFVQDVLKDIAKRVTGIDDTTRDMIRAVIGQTELSVDEKRARLQEMLESSAARAESIARTETADAMERGNHLAWKSSGQVAGSEWLLGPNPCPICEGLSGKIVPLGEEFAPGILHAPAHPSCVCATAPVVK